MKISKFVALFVALGGVTVGVTASLIKQSNDSFDVHAETNELQNEYVLGDVVQIPTHTFEYGGETATVKGTVIYPDGTSNDLSSIIIQQDGDYIVRYTTILGGKNMFFEKKFTVAKSLVTFNDNINSSLVIDEVPDYAKPYTSTRGLYVSLAKGDTATLEVPIDTSLLTSASKVVNCFITPSNRGEFDFSSLTFTLTDLNDPDIYINVHCSTSTTNTAWEGISYWTGNANGQTVAGLLVGEGNDTVKKGSKLAGTKATCPFTARTANNGVVKEVDPAQYPLYFSFDLASSTVYSASNYANVKTCVFTSSDYYSSIWTGFKSNRVKLSFSASSYKGAVARFCITDVLGVDLTSRIARSDDCNAVISVNDGSDDMPNAQTGKSYNIPVATATEPGVGNVAVKSSVYYNYASSNPININTNNGTFTPNYPGYYAIVYEATNSFNVTTKKVLWVLALDQTEELSFTYPASVPDTCKAGEFLDIDDLTDITGGCGRYTVTKYATKGNEKVDITGDIFQPLSTGEWVVRYTVTDYVGNTKSVGKVVDVQANNGAAFASTGELRQRYISGQEYEVPEVYGYTFEDGTAHKALASLTLTDDHGTNVYEAGTKFTPYVENANTGSDINLVFKLKDQEIYEMDAPIIVSYIDNALVSKNFIVDGQNINVASATDNGIKVTSTASTQSWNFFNPLVANTFSLTLTNLESGVEHYDTLKITLVDTKDSNKKVSLYLDATDSDNKTVTVDEHIYSISADSVDLDTPLTSNAYSYSENTFKVGTNQFSISHYDNGDDFDGFEDLVYLNVESTTSGSGKGYYVTKINNNGFSSMTVDKVKPDYYINGSYGGTYGSGDVYFLNSASFVDVISPIVNAGLTVYDPNGNIAVDCEGNAIDYVDPSVIYSMNLDLCGQYTIEYSFDDGNSITTKKNTATFTYYLTVLDVEGPSIVVKTSWTKSVKVGDTIVCPNFDVYDNDTETEDILVRISVVNPQGCEKNIYDSETSKSYCNSVVTDIAGTYIFKIMAIDETGNISLRTFSCTVNN